MSSNAEKIKSRLSIVDVVGSYLKLEKAGSNLKAPCPFHNEKTPSFFVSPTRDTYHCFGCNRGGDIFSFVQEIEGLDFYESLKLLADRAGIEITFEGTAKKDEKDTLRKIHKSAAGFYVDVLLKNIKMLEYLHGRGLTDETIKEFSLGAAQKAWQDLYNHLSKDGFTDNTVLASGLVIERKKEGQDKRFMYDRFRDRIMFPLYDISGNIIAFSGRAFDEGGSDPTSAKYINSPQTSLYDKSSILYPYSVARESIRKKNYCILVEGQMDVLLSHQAGFKNTVAVSGTAFTTQHLALIKRLTENIIISFDSDKAGLLALIKTTKLALAGGFNVKVPAIPKGKDPADIILDDAKKWANLIKESKHVIEFFLDHLRNTLSDKRAFALATTKHILPLIARIENKVDQAHFVKYISDEIDVPEQALYEELNKIDLAEDGHKVAEPESLGHEKKQRGDLIIDRLSGIYVWQKSLSETPIDLKKMEQSINENLLGKTFTEYMNLLPADDRSRLAFEAELCYKDSQNLEYELSELLHDFEVEMLKERHREATKRLKEAERAGNKNQVDIEQKQIHVIMETLAQLLSSKK
tara:strand:- start:21725 stop:23464 length:1740 start_codon:yes stop_codon:yes gene_type:complete